MRKVLSIIVLLGLFSACTKGGKNISITGFVENPITGLGISDVQIKLLKTADIMVALHQVVFFMPNIIGYRHA